MSNNQFGISGIGSDVTLGKRGGRFQYDKASGLFKITGNDGVTLSRIKILDAVEADEAVTKSQAEGMITAATGSLGTMSTQDADAVAIIGGNIDGTVIGGTTAAAGSFTTLSADSFNTDVIGEKTIDAGVTIDGVLLKDGNVTATDLTVNGNLTVLGETTSLNVTTVNVEDNIMTLNAGETGAGVTSGFSGIEVDRGTVQKAQWVWDEVADAWVARTADGQLAKIQGDIDVIIGREDGGFGVDISGYAADSLIFADGAEFAKGAEHQVVTTTATGVEYKYVDALRRQTDGAAIVTTDLATSVDGEYLEIMTEVGAMHLTARNAAGTGDVDLYLQGQGNGDVIIAANTSNQGLIIGEGETTLTISGGDSAGTADAGDMVIKGGNGSTTFNSGDVILQGGTGGASEGIVIIKDSAGNEVASFTGGTAGALDYVDFVNGIGEATIKAVGDSTDVNLVLQAKGAGYVVAPVGYDLTSAPDEAFVTKGYVDTAVTAAVENNTDPLVKRASFTANGSLTGFDVGTLANVAGKQYFVSRITLHVSTELSGASVENIVVSDGVATLASGDESDVLADTYIIDLPFATASAGGSTFSVEFQNAANAAVAPTLGAMTAVVEYKVV